MGREIRMVPANWKHPKQSNGFDQPMCDKHIEAALAEWLEEFDHVRTNGLADKDREFYPRGLVDWLRDNSPPDPDYYRPWRDEDATWFQVWETVSEGTPATPPFATKEALVDYLVYHGDFWQQQLWKENDRFMQPTPPGYPREAAEKFVMGTGWAPTFVTMRDESGIHMASGIDTLTADFAAAGDTND